MEFLHCHDDKAFIGVTKILLKGKVMRILIVLQHSNPYKISFFLSVSICTMTLSDSSMIKV